jgi:hypothetical protein
MGELLSTLPERRRPVDRDRLVFARLHREIGLSPALWTRAEAAGLGDRLADLRRTLELDAITSGHLPLIAALQATAQDGAAPDSAQGLAALTQAQWVDLAYAHGTPRALALAPADYAQQLQRTVEQRYPCAVLRERLRAGTLHIAGLPSAAAVQLLSNHPDFDIRADNVDQFIGRIGADAAELGPGLRRLARVLPLAGSIDAAALLLDQGFDSAHAIARASLPALTDRFGSRIPPDTLRAIHNTAQGVAATHLALASRLSPRFNGHAAPMLPLAKANQTWLAQYPQPARAVRRSGKLRLHTLQFGARAGGLPGRPAELHRRLGRRQSGRGDVAAAAAPARPVGPGPVVRQHRHRDPRHRPGARSARKRRRPAPGAGHRRPWRRGRRRRPWRRAKYRPPCATPWPARPARWVTP